MILEMEAGIILSNPMAKAYLEATLRQLGLDPDLIDNVIRKTIYDRDENGNWSKIPQNIAFFCQGFSAALDARDAGTVILKRQGLT